MSSSCIIIQKINPKEARVEVISEVNPEAVVSEDSFDGKGRKNCRRLGRASGVRDPHDGALGVELHSALEALLRTVILPDLLPPVSHLVPI